MFGKKLGWEDVGPKCFILSKADLQLDWVSSMTLPGKHSHGVMEYVASALDTLIQPTCTIAILVDWDRKGLTTTIIDGINQGDLELLWMLRKMVGTGHASCTSSNHEYLLWPSHIGVVPLAFKSSQSLSHYRTHSLVNTLKITTEELHGIGEDKKSWQP